MSNLQNAYYIYAPRYVRASAGIKALYILAQALRDIGEKAWIITYFDHYQDDLPQEYNDLILDYETALTHKKLDYKIITIYSETLHGNPLKANSIVRYILNVPGLLLGPKKFAKSEFQYAFSVTLAQKIGFPDRHLFIPTLDENKYYSPKTKREKNCVYASKYRMVHNQEIDNIPSDAIEITRNLPDSQTHDELIELLQSSKAIYLFENSAVAIEAVLCGCIVIFIPNKYLDINIGALDHGDYGMAWGNNQKEINRALNTIDSAREGYAQTKANFIPQLKIFVEKTKEFAKNQKDFGIDLNTLRPLDYSQEAARAVIRQFKFSNIPNLIVKAFDVAKRKGIINIFKIVIETFKIKFFTIKQ